MGAEGGLPDDCLTYVHRLDSRPLATAGVRHEKRGALTQLEMDGQNDLTGHGSAFEGRGTKTRKQDRLPGSLLHAESHAPQNFHVTHGPGFVQGELQEHDSFLAQAPGFVRISGLSHADDARPAGCAELCHTACDSAASLACRALPPSADSGSGCAGAIRLTDALLRTRGSGLKFPGSGLLFRGFGAASLVPG